MPKLDDGYISTLDVISSEQRLAFDGYKLEDTDDEGSLGLTIYLTQGQRRLGGWLNIFQSADNNDGYIAKQLARPVLQAIVHYLNAGGDPQELEALFGPAWNMPKLNHHGFKLAGVYDESNREVYFISSDNRVVRVVPGVVSEEVSQEELDEEDTSSDDD